MKKKRTIKRLREAREFAIVLFDFFFSLFVARAVAGGWNWNWLRATATGYGHCGGWRWVGGQNDRARNVPSGDLQHLAASPSRCCFYIFLVIVVVVVDFLSALAEIRSSCLAWRVIFV